MNKNIKLLHEIAGKKTKTIIGLMSGTSLDGLDIALCKVTDSGLKTNIQLLQFTTVLYDHVFKKAVKSIFSKDVVSLQKLCLLNEWIGSQHAIMINNCLRDWKIKNEEIDLIASHGQTIYHAPKSLHKLDAFDNATLQIGDGDHIAMHTGIITVSDFRQKHIAAGGEGAPLALYGDYLLCSKKGENRILLNIGGIANFTFLGANADASKIYSTDIGPGNILMDMYVQKKYTHIFFDENAAIALQGNENNALLEALLEHSFFNEPFPKTTGPELFNFAFLQKAMEKSNTNHLNMFDVMATLNTFSATVIMESLKPLLNLPNLTIYCSGGGTHNPLLVKKLKETMPNIVFKTTQSLGIHPDAKEAILFALLANEAISGEGINFGNNQPSVSMGKISFAY